MSAERHYSAESKHRSADQRTDCLDFSLHRIADGIPCDGRSAELQRQRSHHHSDAKPDVPAAERQYRAHGKAGAKGCFDGGHGKFDFVADASPVCKNRVAHRHRAGRHQRKAERYIGAGERQYRAHGQLRRADDQRDPRKRVLKCRFKGV